MPAYHKVPVLDELQLIVDQHKIKPIDAHAARTLMTKVLTKCSKLGLENAKMRLAYLEDAQKNAKGTLASMEKLLQELEDPWYTPEVFKLPTLQAGLKTIQMQVEGADADGKVLFELMTQYRASWASTIEKVVGKEQDFVDVHIAIRTQTMVLGKQSIGALDRMKEYVKRAEQISKAAEKARAGGEQSAQEAKAEADGLLKLIEQAESDAAKRLIDSSKKSNKLKPFKTQKPYTGKDHKLAESFFQELEVNRKAISGHEKTSLQNEARLKALVKSHGTLLRGYDSKAQAAMSKIKLHLGGSEIIVNKMKELMVELVKRVK